MNALISLFFQRKKKPKEKSVTSALVNDGIVGMINLAAPPTQEKQKALKEKQGEDVKQEKKSEKQVEGAKEGKRPKERKGEEAKKEKAAEEVKEEKKAKQKEKQEKKVEEEKQVEEEKPATVRKRNKRHLKVTIAPGTVMCEPPEKVRVQVLYFLLAYNIHVLDKPLWSY